ncbi:kinase, partial [Thraustotheca clavata]
MDTSLICEVCNASNSILLSHCAMCKEQVKSDSEKLQILLKRFERFSFNGGEVDDTKVKMSELQSERDKLQRENRELTRRLQSLSSMEREPEYEEKILALECQLNELKSFKVMANALQTVTYIPLTQFKDIRSIPTNSPFQLDVGILDGRTVLRKQLYNTDPDGKLKQKLKDAVILHAKLDGADGTILSLIGAAELNQKQPQVFFEYMENGDLYSFLRSTTPSQLPWSKRIMMLANVAKGLTALHSLDIVHKHLSSHHILVNADLTAKLSGLFHSTKTQKGMESDFEIRWTAPEVVADTEMWSDKSDIYSFGLLMTQLDTFEAPYAHIRDRRGKPLGDLTLADLIRRAKPADQVMQHCYRDSPDWYRNLADRCLALDPAKRPSSIEIVRLLFAHILYPDIAPPKIQVHLGVTVVMASALLHSTQNGKQHPYCQLTLANHSTETRIDANNGCEPTWNENF